jgi:hypothetical protein
MNDITIAVTTFMRPGYAFNCLAALLRDLPNCRVILADDSPPLDSLNGVPGIGLDGGIPPGEIVHKWKGFQHSGIYMPFDSGLAAKRNAIVRACETKYLLLFCDDFLMDEAGADGVERLYQVLEQWPQIAVAAGRVDNRPYEAWLEYVKGSHIRERRIVFSEKAEWFPVDLAVNYFMGRTEVMRRFPWPEEMKIGGEHVCFFLDLKLAREIEGASDLDVVWVPDVNVKTMTLGPEAQDSRYDQYRARAFELGHAAMKRRYNIKTYVGMNGDIS